MTIHSRYLHEYEGEGPGNLTADSRVMDEMLDVITEIRRVNSRMLAEAYQAGQARPDLTYLQARDDRLKLSKSVAASMNSLLRDIRKMAAERYIELPSGHQ